MAVEHMVWIRFKDGVAEDRKQGHMANLSALQGVVPEIQSIRIGENFTDRSKGFTHGLIVTLATRDDLPKYLQHPAHVEAAEPMRADAAELMAMDIES